MVKNRNSREIYINQILSKFETEFTIQFIHVFKIKFPYILRPSIKIISTLYNKEM